MNCEVDQLVRIFRELVSRIAEIMFLSPGYSIGCAFDFARKKEKLVVNVANGVMTHEEGRELCL